MIYKVRELHNLAQNQSEWNAKHKKIYKGLKRDYSDCGGIVYIFVDVRRHTYLGSTIDINVRAGQHLD